MNFKKLSALPLIAALLTLMFRTFSPIVLAQETQQILITDNGAGSSNEVVVTSSSVEVGCCPSETDITISGNGAGSDNAVEVEQTFGNEISVSQNATVS